MSTLTTAPCRLSPAFPPGPAFPAADERAAATVRAPTVRSSTMPLTVALLLLAAPNLVFLASFLQAPVGLICVALATAALALVGADLRRSWAGVDRPLLALCCACSVVLCLLGGEAHVFFANNDWLIRDAVLGDLVRHRLPLAYDYRGDVMILRAPLGMYLVPALIGKLFGILAAHVALLVQNSILAATVFYAFASQARSRAGAAFIVAVFLLFSGWDIIGQSIAGRPVAIGTHLSRWAPNLQFSSTITQLFWVPNHALPGWLFVAAYLSWKGGKLNATSLLVVFGLCVMWSPLSAIGAAPFAIRAAVTDLWAKRVDARGAAALALMGLALLPVALYLAADSGHVPHGLQPLGGDALFVYVVFLGLEVLPFAALVLCVRPRTALASWRLDIAMTLAILFAVPLYRIGGNDFGMRASIPALATLALAVARVSLTPDERPRRGAMIATIVVLGFGAATPLYEIDRAITSPAFAISDCNLVTANRFPPNNVALFHYLARLDRLGAAARILKTPESVLAADPAIATCWPDDTGFRG